jgi:hypothetical protein
MALIGDAARTARAKSSPLGIVPLLRVSRAIKIARHRGMKKAIVALARRLAVIMHRMWVDGTEFRWTREVAVA